MDVPIGSSAPTIRALTKSVNSMINSGNNGTSTRATKVIEHLEKKFPEEFIAVVNKKGYFTKQMEPDAVIALMSDANIKTKKLRLINKHMKHNIGAKVFSKEESIRSKLKELIVIEFIEFEEKIDGKNITYRYKDVDVVLGKFLVDCNVFVDYKNVNYMCAVIGGDHGKGFFTMLLTLYIEIEDREPYYMDKVVGEIDSTKDEVDILRPLTAKLKEGFLRCNISHVTGNIPIFIAEHKDTKKRKVFFTNNTLSNPYYTGRFKYTLELNGNGDIKYDMMLMGRSGYDKAWCMYCQKSKKEWTEFHLQNRPTESTCDYFPKWTTRDIAIAAVDREQTLLELQREGKTENQIKTLCPSIGIKETPLWMFLPVNRQVLPGLHILIGIGNKIFDNFLDILHDRIEVLPNELLMKQNIRVMAEIAVRRIAEEVEVAKNKLNDKIEIRKSFNNMYKGRRLSDELKSRKTFIKNDENDCRLKVKVFEKKLEELKKVLNEKIQEEKDANEEYGKVYYVKNSIEKNILRKYKVTITHYHGGALEGNSIRRLMSKGDEIFKEISEYLCRMNDERKIGNENDLITNEEIKIICIDHGNLFCLFDSVFSIINSNRNTFDEQKIKKYIEHLDVAFHKWNQMKFTVPHKLHLLLAHAIEIMRLRKGISFIGEDRIERTHQLQDKDNDAVKRLSNTDKAKELKLKRQAIRNNLSVKSITEEVNNNSKRKRDGKPIEYKIKSEPTTLKKVKREKIMVEVQNETTTFEYKDTITVKIEQKEREIEKATKEQELQGIIFKASPI